jgi:hypothetical protein
VAPFHRFFVRHVIPLAGRLSPDPSAYEYLSRSIFEFGSGPDFEADLGQAGFTLVRRRSFLLGAARLWVARRAGPDAGAWEAVHPARLGEVARGEMRSRERREDSDWRWWVGSQLVLSLALLGSLLYALLVYSKSGPSLPIQPWQRSGMWLLMIGGAVVFAVRTVVLWLRWSGPRPRR